MHPSQSCKVGLQNLGVGLSLGSAQELLSQQQSAWPEPPGGKINQMAVIITLPFIEHLLCAGLFEGCCSTQGTLVNVSKPCPLGMEDGLDAALLSLS